MSEFEIFKETKNPIFNRTEIEISVNSNSTPTKEQVIEFLEKKYSSSKDKIHIDSIRGGFGIQNFNVIARVYSSAEEKNSTETKSKKQRDEEKKTQEEAQSKSTEEPVQEPKPEEKPQEPAKEEKPEETKEPSEESKK
jgi:ribosomal protein S24E